MGYDEGLAHRIRERIEEDRRIAEMKMFGGLAFLVEGAMAFGIIGDELMVRVGPDRHADSLARPHARPMDFTGRPMRGFVQIEPAGFEDDAELQRWLELGIDYAASQAGRTVRARKAERGGPREAAKGGRRPGTSRKGPRSRTGLSDPVASIADRAQEPRIESGCKPTGMPAARRVRRGERGWPLQPEQ